MNNAWPDYELIDFGDGRKLERFAGWVLDRPCPSAAGVTKTKPQAWRGAIARFEGDRAADGEWSPAAAKWPQREWTLRVPLGVDRSFQMLLEPLPSGQIGLFPEQWDNWRWIAPRVAAQGPPLSVLNLFAYTGGSSLAAAAGGANVVHVDAAKSVVARARENAAAAGLAQHPIRWIVEDALKFCRREVKRGNRYDAIILDPPTYGHGPKGEEWNIKRDLLPLLELCGELTERRPKFVLLTCHTPGIGPAELSAYLSEGIFGSCGQPPRTMELSLSTADGRRLPSGMAARWPG
ncbi:class I SAM-dependent methyltransferase [Lacipirellula limnantheis]|uniref:Ribosomal RNA large subunit methyltransferase I n=1 Tax=Lacipirellula limnantheis TaxID=2528024 RepID=A0A517TRD7_9BACT|nr:class I SAM-dependent methyltransferase [Lacipirellula limnantheis]QDT70937.1 Ribosomal RNA large subunit methyltransferase I [Lacipirellula limnantheis]